MPTRILREGIISSSRIEKLSIGAEILYRRIMSVADDYGRFYASPATLRGACWPVNPEKVTNANIKLWLSELTSGDDPLILIYGDSRFLEIQGFGQKVRSRSKFPAPDGTMEMRGRGSVYLIQAEKSKRIKIGYTELDPNSRLYTLQTGSPEKLILLGSFPGTMSDEKAAHKMFSHLRTDGEWFNYHNEIEEFLRAKCGQPQALCANRSRITKSESDAKTEPAGSEFEKFWSVYPKKKSKGAAERAWKSLKPDSHLVATMLAALEVQSASFDWLKEGGQYIPNPATWLNGKRWLDEVNPVLQMPEKSKPKVCSVCGHNETLHQLKGTPMEERDPELYAKVCGEYREAV